MKDELNIHVLFIPKWYPTEEDPQFGVFVQKHAKAVAGFCRVSVVYPVPGTYHLEHFHVEHHQEGNLNEYLVYFFQNRTAGFLGRLLNVCRYYSIMNKGLKFVRKEVGRPDLIHAHVLLRPGLIAFNKMLFHGIPYIVSEHWTGYVFGDYKKKSWVYKQLCEMVVRQASALSAVSESLFKAMKINGLMNKDFRIIPNVVEVDQMPNPPSKGGGTNIRILSVADLVDKHKNISGILLALKNIEKQAVAFEYHVIGGGPDEAWLGEYVAGLGFTKGRVIFHGRQSNAYVLEQLQTADFVIVNSNVETFSVFTAEALACGKPVIGTRCGGPEYLVKESNGILINPNDKPGLEEAILRMMNNYADYDPVAMADDIRQRFNAENIGNQFYKLYLSVLGKQEEPAC